MLSENNTTEVPTFTISESEMDSACEAASHELPNATQQCDFCHCSSTPLWRRGPNGKATLCNACGLRWGSKAKLDVQRYLVNDEGQEGEEIFQLDCRTGEAVPFVGSNRESSCDSPWRTDEGEHLLAATREDGGYSSFEEAIEKVMQEDYGENLSSDPDGHEAAEELWEEDYDKFSREMSMEEDEDSDDRVGAQDLISAEEDDEALHASLTKMEAGKENYYCKYCDTSWPYSHFRNAQQFGAHCSNCSRKRKVKDPQELTIRERNKRLRKAKKISPVLHERRKPQRIYSAEPHEIQASDGEGRDSLSPSSEEDYDNSAISFLQRAAASANKEVKGGVSGTVLVIAGAAASSPRRTGRSHASRKRKFEDFTDSSATEDKDSTSESTRSTSSSVQRSSKKGQHKDKRSKSKEKRSSKKSKPMVIVTPDEEPDQASVMSDPNSLGGLLGAIERKLTAEKKKREVANMKQHVWSLRKDVGEQFDSGLEDLRFRSVALIQELRVDMVAKLEALKIDLASELSFRETRRKKRLNEMRIQMNALNRILESGKKERENGLLLSTFGGKFDTALKQLEELKVNLQKEFATREQAMQQQFTEMRATCSLHLANIKQQMHEELNIREGRMQKELEDMKHKLHSVCSQIGADNYCPDNSLPSPHSPSAMASPPPAENFTTTTTTTTTTTITTNINTTAPLGLLGLGAMMPLSNIKASSALPSKQMVPSAANNKAAAAQTQSVSFGCIQEIKSS